MAAAHCFQTGNGPLFIAGQKQASSTALAQPPSSPPDRRSLQMRSGSPCIQVSLLPARPRPINKDPFTRIFLSDAVTTEFPSPGDDRIQFHAVSLLEASIFTKAVSQQRVLATDAFRLLCSPPSISLGNSPAKARQQAHTQHTKKRIASRVCSAESNLVFGQIQKWCGGRNKGDLPDGKGVQKRKDGSSIIIC